MLGATFSSAAPKTTTFQMKIIKPDGSPLESGSVNFRFTTLSPTGTCVVYVEEFNGMSMINSGGLSVLNLGAGTQIYSGSGTVDYTDVFNNVSTSVNCQGSGSYLPAVNDRRRIVVQFNDGTAAGWQTLPAVDVNSVPYASYAGDAEKISGKSVTDFILSSSLPGSACTGGQVLTYSGGVFSCVASGTGTVSSVTSANSYLSVATGTTTPVLTANVGTLANTLAAGNDARIVGAAQKANNLSDLASAATARTNLGLGTASVLDAGTAATNLVQLDGGAKIPAALLPASAVTTATALVGDVTGTIGATVVSTVGAKTAAQVAQSVTDTLAATNLNTASTIVKRDGSGNIATTSVSATNVSTQNNYLYDNTNTNKILLKAPNAGITDYTFTLPPVIGTANQIIGYNNAGTVLENKSITAGAGVTVTHSAGGIQIAATGSGGTVTSVTSANADIGVATTTSTPVLTLNSGTGADQIVKLDGSAKLPAVDGSALTNLDPTHLSAAVAVNKGGTGATTAAAGLNNLLPTQATNAGKVLQTDGTNASWAAASVGTVTSVTSANSYLTVATTTSTPVITAVVGTGANTLAAGDDSRIVNAVQQTAYNGDIANVLDSNCAAGSTPKWNVATDMWTCVAIGSLNASAITAGTMATARLGSGTADATTYLRGDSTWTALPAGSLSGLAAATATNSIDNLNFAQTWAWSTATTQSPLSISANALTTGSGLNVTTSNASLNSTNGLLRVANTGASTSGILARFQSNSTATSGLTVLTSSNVGIGTTAPAATLDVKPASSGDVLRLQNSFGAVAGNFSVAGGGHGRFEIKDGGAITRFDFDAGGGNLLLKNSGGTTYTSLSSDGSNSYINGNLAIGTTGASTSVLSTVASGAKTSAYTGNYLTNTSTSSTASILKIGLDVQSTGTWDGASAVNTGLNVNVSGGTTNYAATFQGGNVGIGTSAPADRLSVNGNPTGQWAASIKSGTTASDAWGLLLRGGTNSSDAALRITNAGASADLMYIRGDGNVGIGNAAPAKLLHVGSASVGTGLAVANFQNIDGTCTITPASSGSGIACSSDERLKENFQDITGAFALDRILQLQAVTYNFKTSSTDNRRTGYKAQEVQKVAPEFVRENEDGLLQVYYDAFIPWITEAIKTLYNRITGIEREMIVLKAENEKLKQENAAVKARLDRIEEVFKTK